MWNTNFCEAIAAFTFSLSHQCCWPWRHFKATRESREKNTFLSSCSLLNANHPNIYSSFNIHLIVVTWFIALFLRFRFTITYPFRSSLLVRSPDSWSKGCEVESRQERRDNFILQSQLCALTLIRCPFHPRVTAVARKKPRSFYQKCRWQVTPKHAYTLHPTKSEWADYAAVKV